jgi:hypothetical protein
MRVSFVPVFALLVSLAAHAHAQDASPPHDDGPPEGYRALVDSALEEFGAEHWAEARTLFERAHAMFPNARTLRGIGMAAFELRDYVAARRALADALASPRRALTDEQRTQVQGLLDRASVFVGTYHVGPAPRGSTLAVDGVAAEVEGDLATSAAVALAVGAHELVLRGPDGRTARAQVTVHGGEDATLELALPEASAADAAGVEAPPAPPIAPPPPADTDSSPGVWPWVVVTVGGVIALTGGVLLGLGVSDASTVANAPMGTEWADLEGAYGRAAPLEISGGVLLGVGLAAALGGVVWGATAPSASEPRVSVGPGSLSVAGVF